MDQGTRDVSGRRDSFGAAEDEEGSADSAHPAGAGLAELEERARNIRDNLGELVDELDHRRHRAMKPLVFAGAAILGLAVAGAAVGGGVALWRRRQPQRLSRSRQIAAAFRRMAEHPDRVAKPPPSYSVGKKVLGAAA
jgi:hypothetical protein